ncbi:MAG: glycosyltransferase family 39 protein [Rhodospirillales bacterium]|nr:glycosyltransferase family 39 protein [Rhodospirillales bacterium]
MIAETERAPIPGALLFIILTGMFTLIIVAIQIAVGAYHADLGTIGDETGHFVSSLLVFDYLRSGHFGNPMRFARAYYLHWPRVAIGHWPPLFYAIQTLAFAIAGRSVQTAIAFQAVVAGAAAGWPAWIVWRRMGWGPGIAVGLAVLTSPRLLYFVDLVMVDTPLGLWMFAAALAWAAFARRPVVGHAVLFAALAGAAILTKGNGIALALLPLLHAALTRDLRLLRNWRSWLAAGLVGAATAPWYALTYRMAAGGFVYHWGWNYIRLAIPFYLHAGFITLGPIALTGALAALGYLLYRGRERADDTMAALGALVLALVIFQMGAPADLSVRYLIPIVPAGMVLAAQGLQDVLSEGWTKLRPGTAAATVALLLAGNAAWSLHIPHVTPYGMNQMARRIIAADDANRFVLAAGDPHAEGALICAFAVQDPAQRYYVLRGSQELASSTFMGSGYRARFAHAADLGAWLSRSGIGWLVIAIRPGGKPFMEHDRQLLRVLGSDHPVFSKTGPRGEVRLYHLSSGEPTQVQVQALLQRVTPSSLGRTSHQAPAPRR